MSIGLVGNEVHAILIGESEDGVISSARHEIWDDSQTTEEIEIPFRLCVRREDLPSTPKLDRIIHECRNCEFVGASTEALHRYLSNRKHSCQSLTISGSGLDPQPFSEIRIGGLEIYNCWFEGDVQSIPSC